MIYHCTFKVVGVGIRIDSVMRRTRPAEQRIKGRGMEHNVTVPSLSYQTKRRSFLTLS